MELNNFIISKNKKSIKTELWWLVHNIILARYKYIGIDGDNLDMEIDSIERALMYSGMCAIFRNKSGKIVALPCVTQALNQYGRPSIVMAYKFAFDETTSAKPKLEPLTQRLIVGKDCAIIYNNAMRVSSMTLVQPYINRLAKIWKEHGDNLNLSRIFALISANSDIAEAVEKHYNNMLESGMAVVATGDAMAFKDVLTKFDIDVPYRQAEYHADWEKTWGLLLTALGVNNVGMEKRERLLVDEISANNEVLNIITNTTLAYREEGLKSANKLFGLSMKVVKGGADEQRETRKKTQENAESDSEVGGTDTE